MKTVAFLMAVCLLAGCADIGPENPQLAKAVAAKFDEHAALKTGRLRVQAFGHVVYVNGLVDTWVEHAEVEKCAVATPGVEKVINETTIENARF